MRDGVFLADVFPVVKKPIWVDVKVDKQVLEESVADKVKKSSNYAKRTVRFFKLWDTEITLSGIEPHSPTPLSWRTEESEGGWASGEVTG